MEGAHGAREDRACGQKAEMKRNTSLLEETERKDRAEVAIPINFV